MSRYRIMVRGAVKPARLPLLDGADVTAAGAETAIELEVADQSHLDGVLAMLRDRGASLVSVQPLGEPREEQKATRSWWRRVVVVAALLAALVLAGGGYQLVATQRDAARYPAPGPLVDIGGKRLHLHCTGVGTPTVLLDHADGSSSAQWALVQPSLTELTRVCSYDRAGWGWSDDRTADADAATAARELNLLLSAAGEMGPYVHVGHSWGAHVGAVFADEFPDQLAGLVLVDPGYAWNTPGVPADVDGSIRSADAWIVQHGEKVAAVGLMRLAAALGAMPGHRDLPGDAGPAFDAQSRTTRYWRSVAATRAAMPRTSAQTLDAQQRLADVPLLVLSATDPDDDVRRALTAANARLAAQSLRGAHRTVPGADHMGLALDREHAGTVAEAITAFVQDLTGEGAGAWHEPRRSTPSRGQKEARHEVTA